MIWSSPLSDYHKVLGSNQFALPVLTYLTKTQQWLIAELQQIDRETGKIITGNGRKHSLDSKALIYLSREVGGRELKSVENEYKLTKIRAAVSLCQSSNLTMKLVRKFEEQSAEAGHLSMIKDAIKCTKKLDLDLKVKECELVCLAADGKEAKATKIEIFAKRVQQEQLPLEIGDEK